MIIIAAQDGKNSSAENLERTARPHVAPNSDPRKTLGVCNQREKAITPIRKQQVKTMSVVANPPCPNTDGNVLKSSIERNATESPNMARPQTQVIARVRTKNGRIPNRASERVRK
jgi:hypothetical protein